MKRANNVLTESCKDTFDLAYTILCMKNEDYAENSDPFKNFKASELVGMPPEDALLLQMTNKLSRIANLLHSKKKANHESIQDTLVDLINYTAILKAYLDKSNDITHEERDN